MTVIRRVRGLKFRGILMLMVYRPPHGWIWWYEPKPKNES